MAAAKPKRFLIVDPNGEWNVGPVEALTAVEAVEGFEINQGEGLNHNALDNQYDVYEVVGEPTKLSATVQITPR